MEIYIVFKVVEHVGEFFQSAFSTRDKAEVYILKQVLDGVDIEDLIIQEHILDC